MEKVVVSGASGLIGRSLIPKLRGKGFEVFVTTRDKKREGLFLDYKNIPLDLTQFEGLDAWIHLGGESIQAIRWTERKKGKILQSRLESNRAIRHILEKLKNPPRQVFIASGIHFYGNGEGNKGFTEQDKQGESFLGLVASSLEKVWEGYAKSPIFMRLAPVLSQKGGALPKIAFPWKYKMGIFFGNQRSFFPFIYLEELLDIFLFLIGKEEVKGPLNFCHVTPLTQEALFTKLALPFKVKLWITLPRFIILLLLGEFGKETLLMNAKVYPQKLIDLGCFFKP